MDAQKNRHIEMIHLSTHTICFGWEIREINFEGSGSVVVLDSRS